MAAVDPFLLALAHEVQDALVHPNEQLRVHEENCAQCIHNWGKSYSNPDRKLCAEGWALHQRLMAWRGRAVGL